MQRTPPVLHRTLPDGGGKSRGKIARIPETNFPPDFGHAAVSQRQQRLRLRDAGADEVVVRRRTHIAAEEAQEVAAAHVRLTQQVIQRQRLIVFLADGLRRLLDHLLIALRLLLKETPEQNKAALTELFKVEEYVEMVLGYLRTENISSDLTLSKYSLDKIIRDQIHRYAGIFVSKKLSLDYNGTSETILTDEKWLGFVIGQILSNSLKYTKEGGLKIYVQNNTLFIEDTGIGIRPEDLPRVFEKGYTGINGRTDRHSTGIGLYLSKKILNRLGHDISIESHEGKGTCVLIHFPQDSLTLY